MTSAELVDIRSAELQEAVEDAVHTHEVFAAHSQELHDGFPTVAKSLLVEEDRMVTVGVLEARRSLVEARKKAEGEAHKTQVAA